MSYKPFISVVIATYNRAQQTVAAIESVLAQTYPDFEIVIVDDGSTDGSAVAVQEFINQRTNTGEQLHYFKQSNQGPSAARNAGIAKARGRYIAFLDSDDVWLPEKLDLQMQALEQLRNECGACFTDARLVNKSGMDVSSFTANGRHYEQMIGVDRDASRLIAKSFSGYWLSTLLVQADLVRQIGGLDFEIPFAEDRDFLFRLSLVTSFAYVNRQLVCADRTPSPSGSTRRPWDSVEVQFRGQQRMYEKWLRMDAALPLDLRKIVERSSSALHSHWANWHLENARYREARQAVSQAMRYKVTPGITVKWLMTLLAPALARRIAPKTRPIGTLGHAS